MLAWCNSFLLRAYHKPDQNVDGLRPLFTFAGLLDTVLALFHEYKITFGDIA